jgi:outer membrane protein OmpA-like peptidoglycan-associated protein
MMKSSFVSAILLGLVIITSNPSIAQDAATRDRTTGDKEKGAVEEDLKVTRLTPGIKRKFRGVILNRDVDSFIMRDLSGLDYKVNLTNITRVEEKKNNPFRRSKNYGTTQLLRGLTVDVEGRTDNSGALVAEKIKMTESALIVAQTVETRVTPVEGRVGETENRITQAEANAERLSGQLSELQAISNAARGGAKAAQETADIAVAGVNATNTRIDQLVSSLDEFEAKRGISVNFRRGSSFLSLDAKSALDEIAAQAKSEKAYVIEIMGHASSDGSTNYNRRLSQQRADAVIRYLAETHLIPLRRIITPFGYGEAQPVADNATREGREENRRVDVKILVNRGLTAPPAPVQLSKPASTSE